MMTKFIHIKQQSRKKLKGKVVNYAFNFAMLLAAIYLIIRFFPEAADKWYHEQYEKPVQEYKQLEQERLNQILQDNVIDESEMDEYRRLTGQ